MEEDCRASLRYSPRATSVTSGYDTWEEREVEPKKPEANPKPS